jgi:hypothetical protein
VDAGGTPETLAAGAKRYLIALDPDAPRAWSLVMKFRLVSLIAVAGAFLGLSVATASAQWCARMQGGENCGFATLSQCRATISGIGGSCFPSPRGSGYGLRPGLAGARRDRAEPARDWRKAVQERRRAKARELARERQQRRAAPVAARPQAAPAAAPARAGAAAGVALADLDVNAVPHLSRDGVRRVQTALKEKGFDPGPANGVASPRLKDAVRTFQSRYGIAARGDIDNQTLLALGEAELASQSNR